MVSYLLVAALAGAAATGEPVAPITQCTAEGGAVFTVQGETRTPVNVPGPVLAAYCAEGKLYVARGPSGVAVYELGAADGPKLLREIASGPGSAVGLLAVDGQVWMVLESRSAVPIGAAGAAPPKASAATFAAAPVSPTAATAAKPAESTVVAAPKVAIRRVTAGAVELDAGAGQGVRIGDRFAIYRSKLVADEGAADFTGEELVTVVEIIAVKGKESLGQLPRGAVVLVRDRARRARPDQIASTMFPGRIANAGEATLVVRPLINTGTPLGIGVLADIEATAWGQQWFGGLRVQPLGLGWSDSGTVVSTAALVEGGYDAHAFAAGLGAGVSWVNGDINHMLGSSDGGFATSTDKGTASERQETHVGFTVSQLVRLGARDGFNLQVRNVLILNENDRKQSGFIYGGTSARLAIPIGLRSDILLEGGGGFMGYAFGSVGMSTWLVGSGAPGSWRLSVAAGGAGVWGTKQVTTTSTDYMGVSRAYTNTTEVLISGPMVSVGLTRRFAY